MTRRALGRIVAGMVFCLVGGLIHPAVARPCPPAPDPVHALDYGSRYTDDSETRSEIDREADAEVDEALGPVDSFLRELTVDANVALSGGPDARAIANCALERLAEWARADALRALETQSARLTVGSRIAGFALAAMQLRQVVGTTSDAAEIIAWLERLVRRQMSFWELEAPTGARQGNLRAWAGLSAVATAELTGSAVLRGWGAWSTTFVLCTATPDGSLPQEMSRGKRALHYQLHAVAPLVVSAAILARRQIRVDLECDRALSRVVRYTIRDLDDGEMTRARTGKPQTFFSGEQEIEAFQLAFVEAYLTLAHDPIAARIAEYLRPLRHSKLGGDQTLIWHDR